MAIKSASNGYGQAVRSLGIKADQLFELFV